MLGVVGAALSLTLAGALPARAGIKVVPGPGTPNRWLQAVWSDRTATGDFDLFYYNGRTTVQITHNSDHEELARVNDAGHVVWQGQLGGIYLWQDGVTRRLDSPAQPGRCPVMNDLSQVAWVEALPVGTPDGARPTVCLWDGRRVRRIGTADSTVGYDNLRVSNAGHVVWVSRHQITLWDGVQTREIPSPAGENTWPEVNEAGQVVWKGRDMNWNVYLWDGEQVQNLSMKLPRPWTGGSSSSARPQINNRGQVCWAQTQQAASGNYATGRQCVWFWDGSTVRRITSDAIGQSNRDPMISEAGHLVWKGQDTETNVPSYGLLLGWDGTTIRQLSFHVPEGYGNYRFDRAGNVVWEGRQYVAASVHTVVVFPQEITLGESTTGTIALKTPAPRGGAVIQLSYSGQRAITIPKSVTVPAGATRATFPIQTTRPQRETFGDQTPGAGIPDAYDVIQATYRGIIEEAKLIVRGVTIIPSSSTPTPSRPLTPVPAPVTVAATSPVTSPAPPAPAVPATRPPTPANARVAPAASADMLRRIADLLRSMGM